MCAYCHVEDMWIIPSESHVRSVSGITQLEKHNIPCLDLFRLNVFDCYTQDELIQGSPPW